jgi:hypothetical protein
VVKRYPRYSETFIVNEILAHEAAGMELEIFSVLPPEDGHFQDVISRVRAPVTYLPSKGLKVAEFWSALEQAGQTFPIHPRHPDRGRMAAEMFAGEYFAYIPSTRRSTLPLQYAGPVLQAAVGFFRRQEPCWLEKITTLVKEASDSSTGGVW